MSIRAPTRFNFFDFAPETGNFLEEVLAGLSKPQKEIPPKYFYDARGCELFERICALPEYYLTRTETALLRLHAQEMAELLGDGCVVIEFGSGNSQKTQILLDRLRPAAYMPIDIAPEQLRQAAVAVASAYPAIEVAAVCGDYSRDLKLPDLNARARRKVIFFPGSTIGNFTRSEMLGFLRHSAKLVGSNGAILVGVDTAKDAATLNAAYNDAQGVTAQFNLNLLARINRELGADFNIENFRHHAFYDESRGRIEMHLMSLDRQTVAIAGREVEFGLAETIHTENSCKYAPQEFQGLARQAGLVAEKFWTDAKYLFSIHFLAVPGS